MQQNSFRTKSQVPPIIQIQAPFTMPAPPSPLFETCRLQNTVKPRQKGNAGAELAAGMKQLTQLGNVLLAVNRGSSNRFLLI